MVSECLRNTIITRFTYVYAVLPTCATAKLDVSFQVLNKDVQTQMPRELHKHIF